MSTPRRPGSAPASTSCSAAPRSTRSTAAGSTSDGHAGLSLADIAVLYRTDAQSGALGQALTRSGLPFRKGSHDLLQRRTGVPEVIAELRVGRCGPPAGGRAGSPPPPATVAGRAAGRPGGHRHPRRGRAADAAGPAVRRGPGAVPDRRYRWAPASTRWTRAPMPSRCSPCTPPRAWSSRSCSWPAARPACCRSPADRWRPAAGHRPGGGTAAALRRHDQGQVAAADQLRGDPDQARRRRPTAGASPFLRAIGPELIDRPSVPGRGGPRSASCACCDGEAGRPPVAPESARGLRAAAASGCCPACSASPGRGRGTRPRPRRRSAAARRRPRGRPPRP